MFKPFYSYYGNVKFPDTEVDQVIKEMIAIKDKMKECKFALSSYHLSTATRPDKIWQPRYLEIIEGLTKSIGIEKTSTYRWDYWSQLYFPKNGHYAHTHYSGPSMISFVHFIEPNIENSFRFLDNEGNDYVLPEQNKGDIVFFPSYIWHRVNSLKSGRRIVVAGNIEITFLTTEYKDLAL